MLRVVRIWDPVSSGNYKAFDEPFAYRHNKWFFDKSVWQKMFRTLSDCGFNALVLANTHPFPFMVDLERYPEARTIDVAALDDYRIMHRWIFETALDYDVAPHVAFFNIYYPSTLLEAHGINPNDMATPTDFAVEYTHYCVRQLLEEYPYLAGLFADASASITSKRAEFLQQAVVDALDAVRPDAALYVHSCDNQPGELVGVVKRRADRPIRYSVSYTREHLVDANPDPTFTDWTEAVGADNVCAEFAVSNFEPWTCFSYDTIGSILANLADLGCDGFSLRPLSVSDWPRGSDTHFKYQWQRDLVYYSVWGGASVERLLRQGSPQWLLRNRKLLPGFEAGSRILEILALYVAADKSSNWRPQFCSICDSEGTPTHLFSIEDMLRSSARNWWTEITGDRVVHLAEYLESGTPEDAYGPDELIEELLDLSREATEAGEKGMRSASGEKELPGIARDAFCMGRLGEFYAERFRAALAHGRGDAAETLEHMSRALGLYREMAGVDSSHRGPFRIVMGREAMAGDWYAVVRALEAEYADAARGAFNPGVNYPIC